MESGSLLDKFEGAAFGPVGAATSVQVGASNAAFLLAHEFSSTSLKPLATLPAHVIVPNGCLMIAPPGVTIGAAGAGLLAPGGTRIDAAPCYGRKTATTTTF